MVSSKAYSIWRRKESIWFRFFFSNSILSVLEAHGGDRCFVNSRVETVMNLFFSVEITLDFLFFLFLRER